MLILIALMGWSAAAVARLPKPFFDAGMSGGMGYIPDYPAAAQGRFHYLIFPVFHLRGKVFRSDDEDGTRARVLRRRDITFDISLAGSFPTDSKENRARAGMDDLDWIGEIGPRLHLIFKDQADVRFRASVALRAALSTDFTSGAYRGLILAPGLSWERKRIWGEYLSFGFRLGSQLATRELHSYFYGVPEQDAHAERPFYAAEAGYVGTSLFAVFAYERDRYGVFFGGGTNSHHGAANEESPLFKEPLTYSAFMGFRWFFYESEERGAR